jgi:transcriptional regulator with XRE-family HTH domain
MDQAQSVIGSFIRSVRRDKGFSLEALASMAGISYQYLSCLENGKENFTLQVLEALSHALDISLPKIVALAYESVSDIQPPLLNSMNFRADVPLPPSLTTHHVESAVNLTQSIVHRINKNLLYEVGCTLQSLIQGNNFSGMVSNILSNSFDLCTPYRHNHHQRYPDLVCSQQGANEEMGLEVKTTINTGKGGESHNGHSGWHLIACYQFLDNYDIIFVHLMFAVLNGHQTPDPDWRYQGSRVNSETGSRRTETYTTNLKGLTKLRDGSVYLDPQYVNYKNWRQHRNGAVPSYSIFADKTTR